MSDEAERFVRGFCEAWSRRDMDELVGYFATDAVYHNMPVEPAQGHEAIRGVMEQFVPMADEIEFVVGNLASDGDVVLTERVDRFLIGGKWVEVPVSGTFEVRDGKIAAWRDYFDLESFMSQIG